MSMSSYVIFLRDKTDPQYQKFLEVLLTCEKAGVDLPEPETPLEVSFNPRKWFGDMSEGFEIDVDEIPPGVKTICFVNSW